MNKKKIINDPIYGFINIPFELVFDIIEHPYFQRLRRIYQVGMTNLIYPGANHTRFHHTLGALHLMWQSIQHLRSKEIAISDDEAEAACLAILMHDIGHGPFSHALEGVLIHQSHEDISLQIMREVNQLYDGALDLAIEIFTGKYHRSFLHQLVSSELDVDRLDYLNRDSFYSGVVEGKIGTDRIIKMLTVVDNELVIEEKGLYSIEKFLMARKIMYWQVYMHKTVLAAEKMLISAVERLKHLVINATQVAPISLPLQHLLRHSHTDFQLQDFLKIDDIDVLYALKQHEYWEDDLFSYLCDGLLNRKLFRTQLQARPFSEEEVENIHRKVGDYLKIDRDLAKKLIFSGTETTQFYNDIPNQIKFLMKDGRILPFEEISELGAANSQTKKHYLVYPKF